MDLFSPVTALKGVGAVRAKQLAKLHIETLYDLIAFFPRDYEDRTKLLSVAGLQPGEHPIVPVMLYDPKTAQEFARRMLEKGVYVVGFCYPVVPKGRDRIRTQISAGHTKEDLDFAVRCFGEVKKEMAL